jgi:hypothetical protein
MNAGDLQAFWVAEYFLTRNDVDADLLRELVASHERVFHDRRIQIRLLLRAARCQARATRNRYRYPPPCPVSLVPRSAGPRTSPSRGFLRGEWWPVRGRRWLREPFRPHSALVPCTSPRGQEANPDAQRVASGVRGRQTARHTMCYSS